MHLQPALSGEKGKWPTARFVHNLLCSTWVHQFACVFALCLSYKLKHRPPLHALSNCRKQCSDGKWLGPYESYNVCPLFGFTISLLWFSIWFVAVKSLCLVLKSFYFLHGKGASYWYICPIAINRLHSTSVIQITSNHSNSWCLLQFPGPNVPSAFRSLKASASSSSAQVALRRLSRVMDDLAERVGNGSVAGQAVGSAGRLGQWDMTWVLLQLVDYYMEISKPCWLWHVGY